MARDKQQYSKTREDFDRMSLEDRAAFLIEATFSTAADAIDRAGKGLADFAEEMDAKSKQRKEDTGESTTEGSDKTRSEDVPND